MKEKRKKKQNRPRHRLVSIIYQFKTIGEFSLLQKVRESVCSGTSPQRSAWGLRKVAAVVVGGGGGWGLGCRGATSLSLRNVYCPYCSV